MRYYYSLVRPLQQALVLLMVGAFAVAGVLYVHMAHEKRALQRHVCELELRALLAARPALTAWVRPVDPCIAMREFAPRPPDWRTR